MTAVRVGRSVIVSAAIAGALVACKSPPPNDVPDASESPQAKAEPAPLANVAVTANAPAGDAGPPPETLRADRELDPDPLAKDAGAGAWEMEALVRPVDPPPAFRGPETNIAAIDATKRKMEPRLVVDFTASRARIVLDAGAYALPLGTELRGRAEQYGWIVTLPDAAEYRVAAPGSLRALFDDRRLDVEPLAIAEVVDRGDGARRLGYRTRRVDVTNRAASATFEIARVPDAGEGGALLCRALLDWMNAPPSTRLCGPDDVPLHAEWRWAPPSSPSTRPGGAAGAGPALAFDATSLERRGDLAPTVFAAPPPGARFASPAFPLDAGESVVSAGDLASFRTGNADVPAARAIDGGVAPPASGLLVANGTDQLRFVWLDGVPVAWVTPGGRLSLTSLFRGRYGFAWRSFLADAVDPPITITVPSLVNTAIPDAGAP